jgi:hypothetical protein
MLTFRFVEEELSEPRDCSAENPLAEEGRGQSMPTAKGETISPEYRAHRVQEMSRNEIDSPGCYVLIDSGDVLRIPQEALDAGHSPMISVSSVEETRVAKLTDNPADPIWALRTIAADNDYFVHF